MLLPIQICHGNDSFNQILLDENDSINIEFKELYEKLGEAMFRSKVRRIEKGEKATNYFFNLEKRNYEKKVIAQLKLENGEIISDIKQINKEIESFYSNLQTRNKFFKSHRFQWRIQCFCRGSTNSTINTWGIIGSWIKSDTSWIEKCLEVISKQYIPWWGWLFQRILRNILWPGGLHLLNLYNEAFNKGQLSISQRRGVICLIPKDDSCSIELTNWRPLTLLKVTRPSFFGGGTILLWSSLVFPPLLLS